MSDGPKTPAFVVLAASYLAGSVPFSGLAARWVAGVDLRSHGSGTVSGTGLFEVAGFAPLAVAGSGDVLKGAVGPAMATSSRPYLAAAAGGLGVIGHNWSPWLGGAGGRGISPALGALGAQAPEGAAILLGGLTAGRLLRHSALGTLVALAVLAAVLARRRGLPGLATALWIAGPMVAKRISGNRAPANLAAVASRVLFDRDPG